MALNMNKYEYSEIERFHKQFMSTKIQSVQEKSSVKGIAKKILCPEHRQKYIFKCEYSGCESPFMCNAVQCIENHEHEGRITMSKFSTESIATKFYEVDSLITDDTIYENAKVLKNYIQGLKESIKNVYVGIKNINQNYDFLKGNIEGPLTLDYIDKVQDSYSLNKNVRKNLDELKEKVKIEFPVKDSYFSLRSYLIEFLGSNIACFNWSKSKEIHSSKNQAITCQKFHQKLAGLSDLIFIFIGESRIVGSYYSCEYPTLADKSKKDIKSFLFISGKESDSEHFIKFEACPDTDQHIFVSQKNYICQGNTASYGDGIRTFHKNFQNIQYCLPSNTYKCPEVSGQIFNGTLKVRRFMILQAYRDRIHVNEDEEEEEEVMQEFKANGVSPDHAV